MKALRCPGHDGIDPTGSKIKQQALVRGAGATGEGGEVVVAVLTSEHPPLASEQGLTVGPLPRHPQALPGLISADPGVDGASHLAKV